MASLVHQKAVNRIDSFWQHLALLSSTLAGRFQARLWGIELGVNSLFYGVPQFKNVPDASIIIGANCRFRSASWSNMAGINRPCMLSTLRPKASLVIGSGCGFSGTVIAAAEHIRIGNNVMCGANTFISDTDWHSVGIEERRTHRPGSTSPVIIEDNTWLGLNVVVLKGVTIGENSVIGAGSIVTHSIPAGVLAAGQPARVIREL